MAPTNTIDGGDMWLVLCCAGCDTVTFVHENWFSEDYDITEDGREQIVHRTSYPPSPRRRPIDHNDIIMFMNIDEFWIAWLLRDVYSAAGMGFYSLATMGARAIIDHLITSRSGSNTSFSQKVESLVESEILSKMLAEVSIAAFEAGSAAAHRGYSPNEEEFNILMGITESLLNHLYILPGKARSQVQDAQHLREKTPARTPRK